MITRSSIAFEDFLGSSIAPQVMLPCNWLNGQPTWGGATEGNRGSRRCHTQWALLRNQKSSPATRWVPALWEKCTLDIDEVENWPWQLGLVMCPECSSRNIGRPTHHPNNGTLQPWSQHFEEWKSFGFLSKRHQMIYFLSSESAPTDSKANAESNVSNGIHPSIDCAAILISYDFEKIIWFSNGRKNKVIWEIFVDIYHFLRFFYLWRMSTRLPSSGIIELSTIPVFLKRVKTLLMLRNV